MKNPSPAQKRVRKDKHSGKRTETASVRFPILERRDSTPSFGEHRAFEVNGLRTEKTEDGKWRVYGHAAVFDSPSKPLRTKSGKTFIEKIAPGAFKRSLESGRDIAMFDDHDPTKVLARTGAGTLKLSEDDKGLAFQAILPDTTTARDLVQDIEHGNKTGVSFGFGEPEDKWTMEGGTPIRTLLDIPLGEVSPTPFPAYPATDISVRAEQAIERLAAGEAEVRYDTMDNYSGMRSMAESCRSMCRSAHESVRGMHEALMTTGRPLNDHEKRAVLDAHEEAGRLRSKLKDLRSHIRDEYMGGEVDDDDDQDGEGLYGDGDDDDTPDAAPRSATELLTQELRTAIETGLPTEAIERALAESRQAATDAKKQSDTPEVVA